MAARDIFNRRDAASRACVAMLLLASTALALPAHADEPGVLAAREPDDYSD